MPQINLLPPEFRRRRGERRIVALATVVGVAVVAFLVLLYVLARMTESNEKDKLQAEQARTAQVQAQVSRLQQFGQLQQQVDGTRTTLATALTGDVGWSKFLNDLSLIIPDNSWLTNLQLTAASGTAPSGQQSFGTVTFVGVVVDFPGLAGWLTRIAQINGLSFVYLTNGQKQQLGGQNVVQFGANANISTALLSQRCQPGKTCP